MLVITAVLPSTNASKTSISVPIRWICAAICAARAAVAAASAARPSCAILPIPPSETTEARTLITSMAASASKSSVPRSWRLVRC